MKRIFKSIFCMMLLFTMSLSIVGCSNNDKNENTGNDGTSNDTGLEEIDTRVKSKFSNDYTVNRNDVEEALNYIRDNLDKVKDKEVAKKLYEHASYLVMAADQGKIEDDNTIRDLGVSVKKYASKVHNASESEIDDIMANANVKFDQFKLDFDQDVDKFMTYFE